MRAVGLAFAFLLAGAEHAPGQALPFAPGERLTYEARVARLGRIGTAVMSVDGPADVRGQPAWHLEFRIDSRIGFVRVLNVSESWIDAPRMTALRFHKREQHPLSSTEQRVEVYPAEQRWESADGGAGRTMAEQPLDELSFIYLLRTMALAQGGALRFDRHFDMSRNPTLVTVVGRARLETKVGAFATIVLEMHVRDGRYGGGGKIRVHLSDDERRLPVRIESSIPVVGRVVLTLESMGSGGP